MTLIQLLLSTIIIILVILTGTVMNGFTDLHYYLKVRDAHAKRSSGQHTTSKKAP